MDTLPATVALESMTKEESADEEHDGVFPGSGADHGDPAQSGGGVAPHVAILKTQADTIRSPVLRTAEKVPEDLYAFNESLITDH